MSDLEEQFCRALSDSGMDAEVTHQYDNSRQVDRFLVKKEVGDRVWKNHSVITVQDQKFGDTSKIIAQTASSVARDFQKQHQERVTWGDNAVLFDFLDDPSVECLRCGANTSIEQLPDHRYSEFSQPNPYERTISKIPKYRLKFLLLALLRDECDPMCPHSHRYGVSRV